MVMPTRATVVSSRNKPRAGLLPTCAEAGVLGALTGIVGAMQAMEVIKEITGMGEGLVGRMIMFDAQQLPDGNHPLQAIRRKIPLNGIESEGAGRTLLEEI